MTTVNIEDIDFSLFYDYDQRRDGKLSKLTDAGRVQWFRARVNMVFLEPVRRMIREDSHVFRSLHSRSLNGHPPCDVAIAAFSVMLNAVEAFGSFLPARKPTHGERRSKNVSRFLAFMEQYMKRWCRNLTLGPSSKPLVQILWEGYRNGIAHQFVIENGGIEYDLRSRWAVRHGVPQVNPRCFLADLKMGLERFFSDVSKKRSQKQKAFMTRFKEAYPH